MRWSRSSEHVGEGLNCQGLRKAGDALDEQVPAGEQPDEHALEHHLLADDYSLHLEEGGLEETVPHVADRDRRLGLCHCLAPFVWTATTQPGGVKPSWNDS